jgi:hypothetical protein
VDKSGPPFGATQRYARLYGGESRRAFTRVVE